MGGGGAGSECDDDATMTRVGRREGGGDAGDDHDEDDANDAAANDDVVVVVVVDGNYERDAPASLCDITASPIPPKIAIDPPPHPPRPRSTISTTRGETKIFWTTYIECEMAVACPKSSR